MLSYPLSDLVADLERDQLSQQAACCAGSFVQKDGAPPAASVVAIVAGLAAVGQRSMSRKDSD